MWLFQSQHRVVGQTEYLEANRSLYVYDLASWWTNFWYSFIKTMRINASARAESASKIKPRSSGAFSLRGWAQCPLNGLLAIS
jgi:hypothetical protein